MDESTRSKVRLPRWAQSDAIRQFTERKLAPYRAMTPDQRALLLPIVCRAAARQAMTQTDPARIFSYRAPISEKTRRLLDRLRESYRSHGSRT